MEQQQFIPRKRTAWQKFIYNPYLDYVTLLLLLAATLLIGYFARPRCNFLFFTDLSLSFPFQEREVVPLWLLLVLILPCTMVVIAFVMLITARSSWFRCMHRGIFVLFQALVLQQLFVEVTKVLVGRYRPDFLARVQRYMLREGISVTPTYMELCNVKDSELRQGRVSFVSGHASSMFCAMAVICYVGYVRLRVSNDGPFAIWLPLARLTLCVSPFFAAIMVAASRFWDHRHHISDILGGAVLGTAVAFAVCRIHHRRLLKGLHPTIFVPKKREQEALPPLVHPGSFIYTSYPSNLVNVPQVPTSVPTSAPTYPLPAQNPLPQNSPYPIHIPAMVGQPVVQV